MGSVSVGHGVTVAREYDSDTMALCAHGIGTVGFGSRDAGLYGHAVERGTGVPSAPMSTLVTGRGPGNPSRLSPSRRRRNLEASIVFDVHRNWKCRRPTTAIQQVRHCQPHLPRGRTASPPIHADDECD